MRKAFSKKMLGLSLGVLIFASPLSASAKSLNSLEQQNTQLSQQVTQVNKALTQNQNKIHTLTGEITKAEIKIGQTQAQVKALNTKIADTQTRIDKRTEILKQQVTASYKQGGATPDVLNLLLDSQNFGDFINRAFAFYKITSHQQDLINQQAADEASLKNDLTKVAADNQAAQKTAEDLNQAMADLKTEIDNQKSQIQLLNNKKANVNSEIQAHLLSFSAPTPTTSTTNTDQTLSSAVASTSSDSGSASPTISIPALPSAATSGSVGDLIANSKKWIGHSTYVFGGGRTSYDASHGRFDCSGFVHWAYDSIGIDLGGWSTSTLQYVGRPVAPSDMQPGDLIFFNTYEHNGHVGIYIGNGEFIGSQDSTGVAIVSMNNNYWSSRFSGVVRRVLN